MSGNTCEHTECEQVVAEQLSVAPTKNLSTSEMISPLLVQQPHVDVSNIPSLC